MVRFGTSMTLLSLSESRIPGLFDHSCRPPIVKTTRFTVSWSCLLLVPVGLLSQAEGFSTLPFDFWRPGISPRSLRLTLLDGNDQTLTTSKTVGLDYRDRNQLSQHVKMRNDENLSVKNTQKFY